MGGSFTSLTGLALGPFCGSYIALFFPAEIDSVGEFKEIEGQKRSSAWCRGLNWA